MGKGEGGSRRFALSRRSAAGAEKSFAHVVEEVVAAEAVDGAIKSVDRAGRALKESPTIERLEAYKEAIREVLTELQKAYRVEELRGFSRYGKRTIHVLVRVVDESLDELARLVIARSQDTLRIAARIDDIRGILLDYRR